MPTHCDKHLNPIKRFLFKLGSYFDRVIVSVWRLLGCLWFTIGMSVLLTGGHAEDGMIMESVPAILRGAAWCAAGLWAIVKPQSCIVPVGLIFVAVFYATSFWVAVIEWREPNPPGGIWYLPDAVLWTGLSIIIAWLSHKSRELNIFNA